MANVCNGCADALAMERALDEVIARYKGTKGPLIPVLHEAQAIYGYLPFEVQLRIAEGLDLPLADVYGVVSFYTGFTTKPKGKYRVSVCMGTACYVKGAEAILDKFKASLGVDVGDCTDDGRFSLDACRCVGACGLAPVVMINDDVYGNMTVDKVEEVLKKYEETEVIQEGN